MATTTLGDTMVSAIAIVGQNRDLHRPISVRESEWQQESICDCVDAYNALNHDGHGY